MTEWQLRAELDTWLLVETSGRTPHSHVTSIKRVILYVAVNITWVPACGSYEAFEIRLAKAKGH
jgi:hypothetical protein